MLNTLLHLLITFIFLYWFADVSSTLSNYITIDSLINAITFVKVNFSKDLTKSQIIASADIYGTSLIDRYIYYILLTIIVYSIKVFFWLESHTYIAAVSYTLVIPKTLTYLLKYSPMSHIIVAKETIIKIMMAKQIKLFLSYYSKTYLNKNIKIKYTELLPFIDDYNNILSLFFNILKNSLLLFLLSKAKNNNYYYELIKYIYNYKTGELINSYNYDSARTYLISTMENKRWEELSKPNIYKAIFHLYDLGRSDEDNIIKIVFINVNLKLLKFFTIWSLTSVTNTIYVPCVLSLLFVLNQSYLDIAVEAVFLAVGCIVNMIVPSHFVCCFIFQFGSMCVFNKLSYFLFRKAKKKVYGFTDADKDALFLILGNTVYCMFVKYVDSANFATIFMGNATFNLLTTNNVKNNIVLHVIVLSTYMSGYDMRHIVFNSFVMFLIKRYVFVDEIIRESKKLTKKLYGKSGSATYTIIDDYFETK